VKRNSLIRWSAPTLLAAVSLLSGCSWFHRDTVEYYKKAQETRPLEVPPDLDTPVTAKELVVPGVATPAAPARVATAASPSAAPVATTPTAAPPSSITAEGNELHVADSVDNAFQRVGLALERAQIGTINSRDAAAHSYAFDFNGSVEAAEAAPTEHHWYSRILHPFGGDKAKTQTTKSALRINVSEDGTGARVNVSGNADDKAAAAAVQRVLQVLRERLS
jgi:uncharacterized lipoprotein